MNTQKTEQETPAQTKSRLRKVAAATIVGSMLEWYDFYLYATMASIVFSKVFFDTSDPANASLQAFATFAIGFVARPIGGGCSSATSATATGARKCCSLLSV